MKVLLLNGSPHNKGSTYAALSVIAEQLHRKGIETNIIGIGNNPVRGCIGCHKCRCGNPRCIYDDDIVNQLLPLVEQADSFVFGSPVYFASANGSFVAILDRLFTAGATAFQYKPAAVATVARRAGTTATYDQLIKYIGISKMIMVPASYWNMAYGNNSGEEVLQDEEGVSIMKSIGSGMAWILQLLQLGRIIPYPCQMMWKE